MKINILGAEYTISELSEKDNVLLKDCDGFCDWTSKEIVVERDMHGNLSNMEAYKRKVIRHEIVHAFLLESGLAACSTWAGEEEMVDWVARQGPALLRAWDKAGAL